MARYKTYNTGQDIFIPISFSDQILPGTFEYALNEIVDKHLDLSVFEARYKNDDEGRPAYDPRLLLKIVIYGYARGLTASRDIAQACRRHVTFMALSADSKPHFTTIADFISTLEREIVSLFRDVLLYCDQLGLIGKEHFAIDGCKLPSNASKQWSGTHAELKTRQQKFEAAAQKIVERHKAGDVAAHDQALEQQEQKKLTAYRAKLEKIKTFLQQHPKNLGPSGKERKSNITDPDSAKMATSHGVIQGYNGVAVVDGKHQIVVHANAAGEGQEAHLLGPMAEATRANFQAIDSQDHDVFTTAKLTADAGYHSEKSVQYTHDHGIDAYLADRQLRKRDPAFANADRYKERARKEKRQRDGVVRRFQPTDFAYDEKTETCRCPAGESLYRNGRHVVINGHTGVKFKGAKRVCGPCALRARCLKDPHRTDVRQVVFFNGRVQAAKNSVIEKMKQKIDSLKGRFIYNKRLATVEPVFANIQNKGLKRFTLRGRQKVDAQWKLFMLVHNIEKIGNYGMA